MKRFEVTELVFEMWKIEPSKVPTELISSLIIGQGSLLGRIEGPKPESSSVLGESDFSHPFPPVPLPDSPIEFCRFRWRADVLHGKRFGGKEVMVLGLE